MLPDVPPAGHVFLAGGSSPGAPGRWGTIRSLDRRRRLVTRMRRQEYPTVIIRVVSESGRLARRPSGPARTSPSKLAPLAPGLSARERGGPRGLLRPLPQALYRRSGCAAGRRRSQAIDGGGRARHGTVANRPRPTRQGCGYPARERADERERKEERESRGERGPGKERERGWEKRRASDREKESCPGPGGAAAAAS